VQFGLFPNSSFWFNRSARMREIGFDGRDLFTANGRSSILGRPPQLTSRGIGKNYGRSLVRDGSPGS
jgi:hypothetical protein